MDPSESSLLLEYLEGRIPFEEWSTRSGIELEVSEKHTKTGESSHAAGHSVPFLSLLANVESAAGASEEEALGDGGNKQTESTSKHSLVEESVQASSGRKQKRPRKLVAEETAGGGRVRRQSKAAKQKKQSQPTEEDVEAQMLMKELSRDEARRRKELFNFTAPSKDSSLWVRNKLPQHLKRLMGEANMSFAKGQHEETIRLCTEIIRQAPTVAEPFQTLAMVYEDRNDLDKFFEISLIAAHLKRTDIEQWVKLAEMSVERNDLKRAVNCFSQAIKHSKGDDVELLWQRAGLHHKNGQRSKAMDDYELIKKVLPVSEDQKLFQVAVEMAKLHNELGNTAKAIEVLQEAFSYHPYNIDPNAINLLAELAISEENYDLARQIICSNCGIEHCPTDTDNHQSHGNESDKRLTECEQASVKDWTAGAQQWQNACTLTELIPVTSSTDNRIASETDLALMEQLMVDVPHLIPSEICPPGVDVLYCIPDYLPIDLRGKLVVCLIHGGQQKAAENAAQQLESEDPNEIGDIYLDIIEAYIKKGHPDRALKWLSSLVQTETFNQAGVWLQHAECLLAVGQLEEAASSYEHVVALAPRHLEARLALSLLYQQLNRPDQALQALTQIDESWEDERVNEGGITTGSVWKETAVPEYVPKPPPASADTKDYKLLLHKSMLLFEQGKQAEFVDCGLEMLSYFFRSVYYMKSLREICLYSDRKTRSETRRKLLAQGRKGEGEGELNLKSKEADGCDISEEEWWDLFIKVATALLHLGQLPELRHLAMACAASFRFSTSSTGAGFSDRVRLACGLSCFVCQEYHLAFEYLRVLCQKYPSSVPLWNIMGQLFSAMPDKRTHKFVLRLLLKNPDTEPLLFICGHNSLNASSYKLALASYHRLLKLRPHCPLVLLCIAVSWLSLGVRRSCSNRHKCIVQSFAFLRRYLDERQLCQESYYNIARAFHQLDLKYIAVHYYNKVLSLCSSSNGHSPGPGSLHREAAFNLSLIYHQSGQDALARSLLHRYCTF